MPDGVVEDFQVHSLSVGGDLQNFESHPLDRFEEGGVDRRADGHGVAGAAGGLERQVSRLHAAGGDDDFIRSQGAAGVERPPGNLGAQPFVSLRRRVGDALLGEPPRFGGKHPVQFIYRRQLAVGYPRTKRDECGIGYGAHDLQGHIPDDHRIGGGLYRSGPHRRFGKPGADVIARLGTRLDQPRVFQPGVGLHNRVDADPHLPAQSPYGRYLLAGTVGAVPDHPADPGSDLFVPQHGSLSALSVRFHG